MTELRTSVSKIKTLQWSERIYLCFALFDDQNFNQNFCLFIFNIPSIHESNYKLEIYRESNQEIFCKFDFFEKI